MNIEWLRDLVICIFGLGATVVIICVGILAFILYFKVKPVLKSVKTTTKTVENITTCVGEDVVKPIVEIAAVVQGIRQVASMVGRFSHKEGGKK